MPTNYINVEINGVILKHLRVMAVPHPGKCARSGQLFAAGAIIGFKDRNSLTAEEQRAVFGAQKPKHLTVLLAPEEISPPAPVVLLPEPPEVVRCHPDPVRLAPFREFIATDEHALRAYLDWGGDPDNEWKFGNVSQRAVAYSCGHLTRDDRPLNHTHDPAELALCERVATESAARLAPLRMGEGRGVFKPFFAAAVVGVPVPSQLGAELVRAAFGGTLPADISFMVEPMGRCCGQWQPIHGATLAEWPEEEWPPYEEKLREAWTAFADWFAAVPGLREHSSVGIGHSDADPGALKPRLVLALTPAGSLVGAINHEVQA